MYIRSIRWICRRRFLIKDESDLEVTEITVEKESDVLEKIEAEEADLFDGCSSRFLMRLSLHMIR